VVELVRRYFRQQREFAYPDPILPRGAPGMRRGGSDLGLLREEIGDCDRCGLHGRRKKLVFGCGDENADIMFIGEAPGADEDRIGDPFVGRAGRLLDKILDAAGFARSDVYITNVVKCRPPGNRNPEPEEIVTCLPFLRRQIEIVNPRFLCALGRFAAQTLLGRHEAIGRLRGVWHEYGERKVICTYHPSACLRNAAYKRPVWEDFQMLRDAWRAGGAE